MTLRRPTMWTFREREEGCYELALSGGPRLELRLMHIEHRTWAMWTLDESGDVLTVVRPADTI